MVLIESRRIMRMRVAQCSYILFQQFLVGKLSDENSILIDKALSLAASYFMSVLVFGDAMPVPMEDETFYISFEELESVSERLPFQGGY